MHKYDEDALCRLLERNKKPSDYLGKIVDCHYRSKKWISDRLGMNEGNDYRLSFPLPATMENKPGCAALLYVVEALSEGKYRILDLSFMWQGKNKVRVTKVFAELWDRLHHQYVQGTLPYEAHILLNDLTLKGVPFHSLSPEDGLVALQTKWGDLTKNGRVGYLSMNPYDYLTMSGVDCSFWSCHALDGGYFSGAIDYMCSENVLVAYATEEDSSQKVGRTLVYLTPDIVVTARHYGCWHDSDSLLVRDMIHSLLGGHWIVKGKVSDYIHYHGCGYLDCDFGVGTYRHETTPREIQIDSGYCLSCGGDLDESEGECGECASSSSYHCTACGERIHEDDVYYAYGDSYCESCYCDRFYSCDCCGEVTDREEAYSVGNDILCEHCFERRAFRCYECKENFYTHNAVEIDGESYCRYCAEDIASPCATCGDLFLNDDLNIVNDECYCSDHTPEPEERSEDEPQGLVAVAG